MKIYEKPRVVQRESLQKISAIFKFKWGGSGVSKQPRPDGDS